MRSPPNDITTFKRKPGNGLSAFVRCAVLALGFGVAQAGFSWEGNVSTVIPAGIPGVDACAAAQHMLKREAISQAKSVVVRHETLGDDKYNVSFSLLTASSVKLSNITCKNATHNNRSVVESSAHAVVDEGDAAKALDMVKTNHQLQRLMELQASIIDKGIPGIEHIEKENQRILQGGGDLAALAAAEKIKYWTAYQDVAVAVDQAYGRSMKVDHAIEGVEEREGAYHVRVKVVAQPDLSLIQKALSKHWSAFYDSKGKRVSVDFGKRKLNGLSRESLDLIVHQLGLQERWRALKFTDQFGGQKHITLSFEEHKALGRGRFIFQGVNGDSRIGCDIMDSRCHYESTLVFKAPKLPTGNDLQLRYELVELKYTPPPTRYPR